MKKWFLTLLLLLPATAKAELVTPQFTQGSMNSTTTTTQEIVEEITITTYGSALNKWSGDNITHTSATSGGIADSDSVFNITTAGSDFTLEIVTRAASQVLEVTEIEREIDTTSTTVSLSVFSQQEYLHMQKKEKPTTPRTRLLQLLETSQTKQSSSKIMEHLRDKSMAQTSHVTDQQ